MAGVCPGSSPARRYAAAGEIRPVPSYGSGPSPRRSVTRSSSCSTRKCSRFRMRRGSRLLDAIREAAALPRSQSDCLTAGDVPRLVEGGLIEVGAQYGDRPVLPNLSPGARREEIRSGKERLEALAGGPVQTFAYPHGRFNRAAVRSVQEAGFRCAVTTVARTVRRRDSPLRVPRFGVENWSAEEFERRLSDWGAAP